MSPAEPIAWPQGLTPAPLFTPGSVILIDCQEQFLDLRAFPVNNVMEDATVIFLRCQVLLSDLTKPLTRIQWTVDSSSILPCDVRPASSLQHEQIIHVSSVWPSGVCKGVAVCGKWGWPESFNLFSRSWLQYPRYSIA